MKELESRGTADGRLTVSEAARQAGVSRRTVSNWITDQQLPTARIGRRRYLSSDDLVAAQDFAHLGDVIPAWRQDRRRAGARLRALREAAGMTQVQLAAASGLTHEAISNVETGKRAPQAPTVRQLAHALDVAPERFIGSGPLGLSTLTVAQAAAQLEVPAGRVQTWLRQGMLPGEKISGQWRVLAVVVAELERSGQLRGRSRRLDPRFHG